MDIRKGFTCTIATAALVTAVFTHSGTAQRRGNQPTSNAGLEVAGHTMHLGMTKAQVAEKLAGTEFTKVNDDEGMVVR